MKKSIMIVGTRTYEDYRAFKKQVDEWLNYNVNLNEDIIEIVSGGAKGVDSLAERLANDAYCIGEFRPKNRSQFQYFKKRRRNNRILETFKDAKYVDIRDNKIKTGSELSCGRTNRSELRNSDKNERKYRGQKVRKGFRSIRRNHYKIGSGDIIQFEGKKYEVIGCISNGNNLKLKDTKKCPNINRIKILRKEGSYISLC